MKKNPFYFFVIGLILAGVCSRLVPHAPNFTAVGATALFAGAILRPSALAFSLPLIILWLSDMVLNNGMYKNMYPEHYKGWVWMGSIWVYVSFLLITLIGKIGIIKLKAQHIFASSICSSILFFIVTNFGVWFESVTWPKTVAGLVGCYTVAIPFFWNTLAADMIFSTLIFGLYYSVQQKYPLMTKS